MKLDPDRCVLVTGAAGFIGKPVVRRLLERGWKVKALVRALGSIPVPPHERLRVICGDVRDLEALTSATRDVAVVVHLAAAKADEKWSDAVNVGGARNIVAACRAVGCNRIINISSQSAKIPRKGTYARTKSEADHVFAQSGLQVTTLLPSIVYGEQISGVFGTVLRFLEKLPLVPVLGDGKWISAPIYVGDVAEAICRCIERDETIGKCYDLGGPDQVTFDEFVDRVAALRGLRRRKVHIPFGVALFTARILSALFPKPPITVSNVLGSNQDTAIDIAPARRDFGLVPLDFEAGLKKILATASKAPVALSRHN